MFLLALLFLLPQVSHADEGGVYDGRRITPVGLGAIPDVGFDAYISHKKQVPLRCEGVEDQLILEGYVGSRYTRRWVYKIAGYDTYHATSGIGQDGCVLLSPLANQFRKELQEELAIRDRNTLIGIVVFFAFLGLLGLYQKCKDG